MLKEPRHKATQIAQKEILQGSSNSEFRSRDDSNGQEAEAEQVE